MSKEHAQIWTEFNGLVNMTPSEIRRWLETEESRSVGQKASGNAESVGHQSGRTIIEIKNTKKAELSEPQWEHMAKVVGYIRRHMAQGPRSDIEHSNWRYSLMNWGHDPLKS